MEAIAREARVAKPTLYKYFPSKEAIFTAATTRLLSEMRQVAETALASDGPLENRVAQALAGPSKIVFRTLEGSPHGDQLYGERMIFAADEVANYRHWHENAISAALEAARKAEPRKITQLLIACSEGISRRSRHAEQIGPALRLLVLKMLA